MRLYHHSPCSRSSCDRFIQRTDRLFILSSMIFLPSVAAAPLPTALLAGYLENPTRRQTVIATYTGVLASLWWLYKRSRDRLLSGVVEETTVRILTWHHAVGPVLYLVALAEPLGCAHGRQRQ